MPCQLLVCCCLAVGMGLAIKDPEYMTLHCVFRYYTTCVVVFLCLFALCGCIIIIIMIIIIAVLY